MYEKIVIQNLDTGEYFSYFGGYAVFGPIEQSRDFIGEDFAKEFLQENSSELPGSFFRIDKVYTRK